LERLFAVLLVSLFLAGAYVPRVVPAQGDRFLYSLHANDFLVYNCTRTSAGGGACGSLVVVWVFSRSSAGVEYGVKSLGDCCLVAGRDYSRVLLDLGKRSASVVEGGEVPTVFLWPAGTSCIAEDVVVGGVSGTGTFCYVGGVLSRATIRYGSGVEELRLLYSSNPFLNLEVGGRPGEGLNLTRVLPEAMPEAHGAVKLPYRVGDFIEYRVDMSGQAECRARLIATVVAVKGPLVAVETKVWPEKGCEGTVLVANTTRVLDAREGPGGAKKAWFFIAPGASGNKSIDYWENGAHIQGWQLYVSGVLVEESEKIVRDGTAVTVTITAVNTSIPSVAKCIGSSIASCVQKHNRGADAQKLVLALLAAAALTSLALGLGRKSG
jgi:hypothetical protein